MSSQNQANTAYRVHIFVDFWNYTLSVNSVEERFPTDWRKLPKVIVSEVETLTTNHCEYQCMSVYGSYDPNNLKDQGLRNWVKNTLETFPGINTKFVPRQKKKTSPRCPICYHAIEVCPSCQADMRGSEEKGVDTGIATDMISLAWEKSYDIAVLVSSDRDFEPVIRFLQSKGVKVIHAAFKPHGAILSQACWASFSLPSLKDQFRRTNAGK